MNVGANLLGLAKASSNKKQEKDRKDKIKESKKATLSTHYQCLDKGASVDDHEERFELVSKRIEHNLKASEQVSKD
jgi:single-stranded DNA-specific DHH superfamily exonuclease